MGYVRDTVNSEIRLEGDDFGAASARIQLPAAPVGAKKMQIVGRAYYDTFSSIVAATGKGWNHTGCFGLRFSDAIPKYPLPFVAPFTDWLPTDFFGFLTLGPASNDSSHPLSGTPTFQADLSISSQGNGGIPSATNGFTTGDRFGGPWNNASGQANGYEHWGWLNGAGALLNTAGAPGSGTSTDLVATTPNVNSSGHDDATSGRMAMSLPANPTTGAKYTFGWEMWASEADKTMYCRIGFNGQALAGDSMFDVFSANYAMRQFTIHQDTTSNWRTDYNTVNFPRWFMMRYASHHQNLVFKEARVRYFDWDENELEV
jgi:hypothetical protein